MNILFVAIVSAAVLIHATLQDGSAISETELFSPTSVLGPIFVPEAAPETLVRASVKFADYLEQISGQEWNTQVADERASSPGIYILNASASTAKAHWTGGKVPKGDHEAVARISHEQTFEIVILEDRVLLIGATAEGTEDAIYFFLSRHLGIKWFIPGELGEEVPKRETLSLEIGQSLHRPSFLNRMLLHSKAREGHGQWFRHNLISRKGWQFNHNLHRIVPPELMETNPEWFARRNGERVPTAGHRGANPNLVNPELQQHVATKAIDHFANRLDADTFSIATTDSLHYDESPATQEILQPFQFFRNHPVYSDLIYSFSNGVAENIWPTQDSGIGHQIDFEKVAPEARDKFLGTLAYYWSEQTPSFQLHPRVIPYLTSDRGQWFSQEYRKEDIDLISRWSEKGAEIVGTWDYYEGWPYFIPRYFADQVGDSIPILYQSGVRAFFAEGVPKWGFDAPRLWLAAQLLWDAEEDPDALLNTFFSGYYKETEAIMREFFAICQRQWDNQPENHVWLKYWMMSSQAELFPLEVWEALDRLLESAETTAKDEKVIGRLALLRTELDLAMAMSRVYFSWKEAFSGATGAEERVEGLVNELLEKPIPPYAKVNAIKKQLIEAVEPQPKLAPPEEAKFLFEENFSERWLHGDLVGATSLPFVSARLDNGWRTASYHNNTFRFTRNSEFAESEGLGARIQGSTYFRFSRWARVTPDNNIDARLRFRGKVSPGSRIMLSLVWRKKDGKLASLRKEAEIPPGDHIDWNTLAEQTRSPAEATRVNCAVAFIQQMPGDYIEIDWVRLSEWNSKNEPTN